jgi:hypothetical protein
LLLTRSTALFATLACAGSLLISGCVASTLSNSEHQGVSPTIPGATTAEFLQHADPAFGTFHQDIWLPYKAGDFSLQHPLDTAAGVRAADYVYRQVQLAGSYAESSGKLANTYVLIDTMLKHLAYLYNQIRHQRLQWISTINSEIATMETLDAGGGVPVHEKVHRFASSS